MINDKIINDKHFIFLRVQYTNKALANQYFVIGKQNDNGDMTKSMKIWVIYNVACQWNRELWCALYSWHISFKSCHILLFP